MIQLEVEMAGSSEALGDVVRERRLEDLDPTEVFLRRYRQDFDGDPSEALQSAFHELLEGLRAEETAA